jgi:hypothetical protein
MDRMMDLTFHEVCDAASAFGFNFGSSTIFANLESKGNLSSKIDSQQIPREMNAGRTQIRFQGVPAELPRVQATF